MYIVRRAKQTDVSTLLKMAKMVHFINLPADKEIINQKIVNSRRSFMRAAGNRRVAKREMVTSGGGISEATAAADVFMFILEDLSSPGCIGTSQLISQMGSEENPNVCFKLETREKYSESLKFGTKTIVAKIHLDDTGPTEIGGLITQPSFRGHPMKLGRFVGLVRFHFIGLHRRMFRPTVLAELMATITADGHNLLWDNLGRRFIPLSYAEADRFCQHSREFMTALLPSGDIHLSLLPPEARAMVGEVGPETVPARKMLEKLGFEYHNFVDPFDGGPYVTAKTSDIEMVKNTVKTTFGKPVAHSKTNDRGIVSHLAKDGEFRAVQTAFVVDSQGRVCVTRDAMDAMMALEGNDAGYTPMLVPVQPGRSSKKPAVHKKPTAKKTAKKTTKKRTTKKKS